MGGLTYLKQVLENPHATDCGQDMRADFTTWREKKATIYTENWHQVGSSATRETSSLEPFWPKGQARLWEQGTGGAGTG